MNKQHSTFSQNPCLLQQKMFLSGAAISFFFVVVVAVFCAFKTESSSCWTKLCTKIIYTLLQAFALLLQISYQKKSFLTTPNIENQSRSSAEFH